jgi:hypothetical protein
LDRNAGAAGREAVGEGEDEVGRGGKVREGLRWSQDGDGAALAYAGRGAAHFFWLGWLGVLGLGLVWVGFGGEVGLDGWKGMEVEDV